MNSKMNTKKTLLASMVGLFAAAGGVGSALGQGDEAATAQGRIDEIIVTANKREQRLQDVPISVAALTGKELEAQGIGDLQALSLSVPGLYVDDSGAITRWITIRGIGNITGDSPLVGIYMDEASMIGHGLGHLDLRIFDLERVEVLKGPQGTLYGEGSVGGTIRYITKNPELDRVAGEITLDGAAVKDGDLSKELKGVINIPLVNDSLGLRVAGRYIDADGWIDQPALSKSDINGYELFNIRSKLLWQPNDKLAITATAIVHRNDKGAPGVGEDENGNFQQQFNDPTTPSVSDDYDVYSLSVNYDFGGFSLVSVTSKLNTEVHTEDFGTRCCVLNPGGSTAADLWEGLSENIDFSMEVLNQEIRLTSNDSGAWSWSAGLFGKKAKYVPFHWYGDNGASQTIRFGPSAGPFIFDEFYQETESTSWAVFGDTSYSITDQLELGVGVRVFEEEREQRFSKTDSFKKSNFDSVNPRFYLSYDVTDDIHLYANVAKGFRSGGINRSNLPPYDPESVWSYEVGSKITAMDNRLSAELALFFSKYDDYQINGFDPTIPAQITSNAGNADIMGLDLYLRYWVTDGLELGFTGNYTDTELTEIDLLNTAHAVGDPLDNVAQYGYSLWANYSFSWFDDSPGYLRLDYSRQGKAHFRNRANDVPSVGFVYHDTSGVLDMVNARLGWKKNSWSLELYALNLLDEDGFLSALDIELSANRPRPRTVGANISYQF